MFVRIYKANSDFDPPSADQMPDWLLEAEPGTNLLSLLRAHQIPVDVVCAGLGNCGHCAVKIFSESVLSPPGEADTAFFPPQKLQQGWRLACRYTITSDISLLINVRNSAMDVLTDFTFLSETSFDQDAPSRLSPGIAIDIGSTTLAAYLFDLTTGQLLKVASAVNPQTRFGGDVISRIHYTMTTSDGTKTMQSLLIRTLNQLIDQLMKSFDLSSAAIKNIVLTGNTTMLHFFLGLETRSLAVAPFAPLILSAVRLSSREAGLPSGGFVDLMPGISAYVGSDITAGILASGMADAPTWVLLLDLGTNGELALGCKERILTCATAAGPAFEGANIQHGCSALPGAISEVDLTADPPYTTIGGQPPIGICGSGVLAILAELLRHGLVDQTGRMLSPDEVSDQKSAAGLREINGEPVYVLYENHENDQLIYFTAKDVREVQLAKAAIRAGIEVLMKEAGLAPEQIRQLYIAGGFGNRMNIASAVAIGLIPATLQARAETIGNGAAAGAGAYLLSESAREKAVQIATTAEYIELSDHSDFGDAYMDAMSFAPSDSASSLH